MKKTKSVKKATLKKKSTPKRKTTTKPKLSSRQKVTVRKKAATKSGKPALKKVKKVKPAVVKSTGSTTPMTDLILERIRIIDGRNK